MAKNNMYTREDILFPEQTIIVSNLESEMTTSYIDYAMSVIVGRALPDVRDGLKPVHRRILYSMYEDNLTHDKPFRKSATAVGNVLGRYHPHGDASVYDALVRLAQDFTMSQVLIDGHGNFGSADNDPAAAYRYTEARLSRLADEMCRDIDKDTVDWDPNFDETRKEPRVMPSRYPNLLVNGSSGIAVGMSTEIPPHNLTEVINAVIAQMDNPDISVSELMEIMPAPDFPTGGIIIGTSGIRRAYTTGEGSLKLRSRVEFEEFGQGRTRIVIVELPYQQTRKALLEKIGQLVQEKRLEGISAARDETDKGGTRIVIELKRDANREVILNQLFKLTRMQISVSIRMLALVDNQTQPKILPLKVMISEYIKHQLEVVRRRTEFDKRKAEERAHLLEGLRIACDNIDEIIRIIRESYNDAKERLMERFSLSETQATAILEMQLRRLQGLEREKIETEYNELLVKIAYYTELLASPERLRGVITEEMTQVRDKYKSVRHTEIQADDEELEDEDLIEEQTVVYTLTHEGYIKRLATSEYAAQKRGGRGKKSISTREGDFPETILTASTHTDIFFFTNTGRVLSRRGHTIQSSGRTAKGQHINNVLTMLPGERITAMIDGGAASDETAEKYYVFISKNGVTKRILASDLKSHNRNGKKAILLADDDELVSVLETDGTGSIIIATGRGKAIRFPESVLRISGR
ncbi:MAG: DNA gyrase subunit A, partial [Oscillospiraceae bacterium]|nr:DNA gyrase subunit A [Oscillospiraceae bacterium]